MDRIKTLRFKYGYYLSPLTLLCSTDFLDFQYSFCLFSRYYSYTSKSGISNNEHEQYFIPTKYLSVFDHNTSSSVDLFLSTSSSVLSSSWYSLGSLLLLVFWFLWSEYHLVDNAVKFQYSAVASLFGRRKLTLFIIVGKSIPVYISQVSLRSMSMSRLINMLDNILLFNRLILPYREEI